MDIAQLIEDLFSLSQLPPDGEREWLPDACLSFSPGDVPTFSTVTAVRADSDQARAQLAATAKSWFAERGRRSFTWFLGPSTTPVDAVDHLLELGATRFEHLTGMLLEHEPSPGPAAIDVREVQSPHELVAARLLLVPSGGGVVDDATRRSMAASNDIAWRELTADSSPRRMFVARLGGEIVAAGGLVLLTDDVAVLAGGATAPASQGRGLYRALVHARWKAVVDSGRSALVVTATPRSAPILARAGFETVTELTVLRHEVAITPAEPEPEPVPDP